jgi:hypothetical protein
MDAQDVEKDLDIRQHMVATNSEPQETVSTAAIQKSVSEPFAGRLGGNGAFVVDRDATNASLLRDTPDAAPCMTLAEQLDLRPFRKIGLWKSAALEGMGKYISSLA